jgi:hypothetical protein
MKRPLFIKWLVIQILTIIILWIAWSFGQNFILELHPVSKVMVGVVLLVALLMTIYSGTLCWRVDTDNLQSRRHLAFLKHQSLHIVFAAEVCPNIGLLGALIGFFVLLSTNLHVDVSQFKEATNAALESLGIAFAPTIAGVFFRITLLWQQHLLAHDIDGVQYRIK